MSWIKTKVGAFCPFTYGKAIKKSEQVSNGYPVYGSNGIYTYSEIALAGPYVVIIGRKGSVGKVHLSESPCWVSDTAFYVMFDSLDEAYFTYYLLSTLGLESMNTDAAVPGLNRENAHRLEIKVPKNASLRQRLVKPLIDLDKKIKNSEQTNQTLEQIAQAIFKSWFVDFEPVKAKMEALEAGGSQEEALLAAMQAISGKDKSQLTQLQTENPENYNQLRTTAELFPSAMQDSEQGEIPEGWLLEPFSNIARLDTTSVKPAKEPEKIWEHYSIPAFDDGMSPAFDLGANIKSNKYRVFPESVLVSKLNPHFPRTWLPDVLDSNAAICSTEFMQFVPIKPSQRAFVAGVVKSDSFQNGIMMRVTGSTGSRQRAQPKQVAEMEVLLPSEELRNIYSVLIAPQLESQASNIREALNLANVRDALLPKLLSGQLQVNSTDQVHTKLPDDKDEHDLNALISEIENDLPPKSHFVVHGSSRKQRHKLGMIGYSTTITGDLGQGGAEYFKLPAFLSELRSNKILQGVFSTVVDSATGVPFLMVVITAVLNKFLGEKVKLDQKTAIVLLSFPENRTCKVSKLLNESNRLSLNAGLSPFDEDELSGTLKRLKVHGLVTHRDRTFTEWALVEKFDHKGARRP
ncbi:restriction endonuclease subunit S [Aliidiomarina taiwanensis]|nr:restriction endonuclease subunit S [Aliidiomarina taiwanensis]